MRANFDGLFDGLPFYDLWLSGVVSNCTFALENTSNMLRSGLMYRYIGMTILSFMHSSHQKKKTNIVHRFGGFYLDNDVICQGNLFNQDYYTEFGVRCRNIFVDVGDI